MSYWDINPKKFKLLISLIGILFTSLISINFYLNISPTDENGYIDIKERLITKREILAHRISSGVIIPDTIPVQSVFYMLEDKMIHSYDSLVSISSKYESDFLLSTVNLYTSKIDTFLFDQNSIPTEDYFYYINSGARIISVLSGGASDRAGLKSGDIIYSVNNQTFKNVFQADSMMRNNKSNHINYLVLSDGKFKEIEVELAKYGVKISFLSMLLSGLICLLFGWFIAFARAKMVSARVTGIALMFAGYLFATVLSINATFEIFQTIKTVFTIIGINLIIPLFIHSGYYFPKYNNYFIKRNWIALVPYLIGSVGIILQNIFAFLIHRIDYINFILLIFISIQIAYAFIIHFAFRKHIDPEIRKMNKYIDFATFILFIVAVLFVLSNVNGWYKLNEFIFLGLIFFPLSYIYTIGRYRLLDLNLKFRRNIQYVLISIFWKIIVAIAAVYIISYFINFKIDLPNLHFTGTTVEVLEKPLREPLRLYYEKIIIIIFAFFVLFGIKKIGDAGLSYLDKLFNRTKLDFQKAFSQLMKMLDHNIRIDELSEKLTSNIADIFQLKRAGFIIFNSKKEVYAQHFQGLKSESIEEFVNLVSPKLFVTANEFNEIIKPDDFQEEIRTVFSDCSFKYIVPVKIKNKLTGIILIGEKLSESSFSPEELDYFSAISSQSAVAIENALLYEDLAQQERMKHELDIARRIQTASLPNSIPSLIGLDIYGHSIPAFEVGGDFYDFLNGKDGCLTVVIGDVSGKGTSAALYMSKAQGIMRTLHDFELEPYELLKRTNNQLYGKIERSSFISAIALNINYLEKKYQIARAGHLPLYHYKNELNDISKIMPKGIALGIANNKLFSMNIEQFTEHYDYSDIFVLITDGILEARNMNNEEYGEFRLLQIIKDSHNKSALGIKEAIINDVKRFSRFDSQFDDMTIVVIKAE